MEPSIWQRTQAIFKSKLKTVKHIKDASWVLYLDSLDYDMKYIIPHYVQGRSAKLSDEGEPVLIEAKFPQIAPCPNLPSSLEGWIETPNWQDFHTGEVEAAPQTFREFPGSGKMLMDFRQSKRRVSEFVAWKKERAVWAREELLKERACRFYGELHSVYDRLLLIPDLEIVVGNGFFFQGEKTGFLHPCILKPVKIKKDTDGNLLVVDTEEWTEFYEELWDSVPGKDGKSLEEIRRLIVTQGIHPLERDKMRRLLDRIAPSLAENCRYVKEAYPLGADWFGIYECPALFLRRKIKTKRDFWNGFKATGQKKILDLFQNKGASPAERKPEEDASSNQSLPFLNFGLNAKQREVLRALKSEDNVLVCAPGKSGKTKTIACIIAKGLTEGKRILVIGRKGSMTDLYQAVPPDMRRMVHHIGNMKDMVASARELLDITKKLSSKEAEAKAKMAEESEEKEEKRYLGLKKRFEAACEQENRQDFFTLGEKSYSLSQMAEFVQSHRDFENVIPPPVSLGRELPITKGEIDLLYSQSGVFDEETILEMQEDLPDENLLLSPEEFNRLLQDDANLNGRKSLLLARLPEWSIDEGLLCRLELPVLKELKVNAFRRLKEEYRRLDLPLLTEEWAKEAAVAGRKGGAQKRLWEKLGQDIKGLIAMKEEAAVSFFGKDITLPEEMAVDDGLVRELEEMQRTFAAKGRISVIDKLLHPAWRSILQAIFINGRQIASENDCALLLLRLRLEKLRDNVRRSWNELLGKNGAASFDELTGGDPDEVCAARWRKISFCLKWYKDCYDAFLFALEQAGISSEVLISPDFYLTPREKLLRDLEWLADIWPLAEELIELHHIKGKELEERFTAAKKALAENTSRLGSTLAEAVDKKDASVYAGAMEKLLRYKKLTADFLLREELLAKTSEVAPKWAELLTLNKGGEIPEDLEGAWAYRQFAQVLEEAREEDLFALDKEIAASKEKISKFKAEYENCLALSAMLLRYEQQPWNLSTLEAEQELYYPSSREKRKGFIKEASSLFPALLVSFEDAFELPPDAEYDLSVVEDAHCAPLTVLPLLSLGKKHLVLGNDEEFNFRDLSHVRGTNRPNTDAEDLEENIYDVFSKQNDKIMFRENYHPHPSVALSLSGFYYNGELIPMSIPASSPFFSVVEERTLGSWPDYVTALLMACLKEPEYAGKTMGIVTLTEEQSKEAREAVQKRIAFGELKGRNFLVGTAEAFEINDRDVIFFYMGEGDLPTNVNKICYQVLASARVQIFAIHDLFPEELSPLDPRRIFFRIAAKEEEEFFPEGQETPDPLELTLAAKLKIMGYDAKLFFPAYGANVPLCVLSKGGDPSVAKVFITCYPRILGEKEALFEKERRTLLEGQGWHFLDFSASRYYMEPQKTIENLKTALADFRVLPIEKKEEPMQKNLLLGKIERRAKQILEG